MVTILVIFARPALRKSRVNKVLIQQVQELEGVTFHALYERYPGYDIDVAATRRPRYTTQPGDN